MDTPETVRLLLFHKSPFRNWWEMKHVRLSRAWGSDLHTALLPRQMLQDLGLQKLACLPVCCPQWSLTGNVSPLAARRLVHSADRGEDHEFIDGTNTHRCFNYKTIIKTKLIMTDKGKIRSYHRCISMEQPICMHLMYQLYLNAQACCQMHYKRFTTKDSLLLATPKSEKQKSVSL